MCYGAQRNVRFKHLHNILNIIEGSCQGNGFWDHEFPQNMKEYPSFNRADDVLFPCQGILKSPREWGLVRTLIHQTHGIV